MRRKLIDFLEANHMVLYAVSSTFLFCNILCLWLVDSWSKSGLSLVASAIVLTVYSLLSEFATERGHARSRSEFWNYTLPEISLDRPILLYIGLVLLAIALMVFDKHHDVFFGVTMIATVTALIMGSLAWRKWLRDSLLPMYPPKVKLEVSYRVMGDRIVEDNTPYGDATPLAAVDFTVRYHCEHILRYVNEGKYNLAKIMIQSMQKLPPLYDEVLSHPTSAPRR